jgi:hypothetical protein
LRLLAFGGWAEVRAAGRVEVVLGLVPAKRVGVDGVYYGVKASELSANRRVCNGGYKSGKSGRDVVLSVEGQVTFHVRPVTRPGVSSLSECERVCCQALLEMNAGQQLNYTGDPVQARGWWKVGVACIKGEEASV